MDIDIKAVNELLEKQNRAFNEFKQVNDEALKKNTTDLGDVREKYAKLNDAMDLAQKELDKISKSLAASVRHGLGGDADKEQKDLETFNALRTSRKEAPVSIDEMRAYNKQFGQFMRRGIGDTWGDVERKTMSVGSDPDGGYFVTPDLSGRIISRIYETSEMRSISSVQSIASDALEGVIDREEVGFGWVGETQARPATSTPTTGKWRIPVFEMYAMPEATQQLLDDTGVNVEAWLAGKVADKFTRVENAAFVNGNGVSQPRGILTYAFAAQADGTRADQTFEFVATGTSGGFGTAPNGSDKLVDLVHKLKTAYRRNARWVMSRATVGEVRKLKDADGNYLWLPNMTANQPASLLGYAVSEFEDFPAIGADSYSIGFGDFREAYQIVDRQGIRTLRDPYTNKPFIRFYTTRRVGGGALQFDCVKFLKFST